MKYNTKTIIIFGILLISIIEVSFCLKTLNVVEKRLKSLSNQKEKAVGDNGDDGDEDDASGPMTPSNSQNVELNPTTTTTRKETSGLIKKSEEIQAKAAFNTQIFSNSVFDLLINDKSVPKIETKNSITTYNISKLSDGDTIKVSFASAPENVGIIALFETEKQSRFQTNSSWKCTGTAIANSARSASLNNFKDATYMACKPGVDKKMVFSATVKMRSIGEIVVVIDDFLQDITINGTSLPYTRLGVWTTVRLFSDITVQAGDTINICGRNNEAGLAFMIGTVYYDGGFQNTNENWTCSGKPPVLNAVNNNNSSALTKSTFSSIWDNQANAKKVQEKAKYIWDNSGTVNVQVCCSITLPAIPAPIVNDDFTVDTDPNNDSLEIQQSSKFDLVNCNDKFSLIQDFQLSSAELRIDDKLIPLDANGVAINTGMKIGSKISLKIVRNSNKVLKTAFSAILKVENRLIMFYSGDSYKLLSNKKLKVFETLTQDFGDILPEGASYIGSDDNSTREETIVGFLKYSKINNSSIKIVADNRLTSVKVKNASISFEGLRDGVSMRTVVTILNSGDEIEICAEKPATLIKKDNFPLLVANVEYFDKNKELVSIFTDSTWKLKSNQPVNILASIKTPLDCISEIVKVSKGISPSASIIWDNSQSPLLCVKKILP